MIGVDAAVNNIAIWDIRRADGFMTDTRLGDHSERCIHNVDRVVDWLSRTGDDIALEFTSVRARASIPMIAHMGLAVGMIVGHRVMTNKITLVSPGIWMNHWKRQQPSIKRDVNEFLKCYPKKDEKKKCVHRIFLSSLTKKERSRIIEVAERYPNALRNNLIDAAGIAYWALQTGDHNED
jgi:hypothetical protein